MAIYQNLKYPKDELKTQVNSAYEKWLPHGYKDMTWHQLDAHMRSEIKRVNACISERNKIVSELDFDKCLSLAAPRNANDTGIRIDWSCVPMDTVAKINSKNKEIQQIIWAIQVCMAVLGVEQ